MLYFLHFPKCAGTSTMNALRDARHNRLILDHYPYEKDPTVKLRVHVDRPAEPVTVTCIHEWSLERGSSYIRAQEWDAERDFAFAFIRHPVRLLVSMYHHLTSAKHAPFLAAAARAYPQRCMFTLIQNSRSLDQFVDWLLDFGWRTPGCLETITDVFDETFLARLHFVGVEERYDESTAELNARLAARGLLPELPELPVRQDNAGVYDKGARVPRMDELLRLFADAVRVYERFAARFDAVKGDTTRCRVPCSTRSQSSAGIL